MRRLVLLFSFEKISIELFSFRFSIKLFSFEKMSIGLFSLRRIVLSCVAVRRLV